MPLGSCSFVVTIAVRKAPRKSEPSPPRTTSPEANSRQVATPVNSSGVMFSMIVPRCLGESSGPIKNDLNALPGVELMIKTTIMIMAIAKTREVKIFKRLKNLSICSCSYTFLRFIVFHLRDLFMTLCFQTKHILTQFIFRYLFHIREIGVDLAFIHDDCRIGYLKHFIQVGRNQ